MKIFITGGCKSGKSTLAQKLAVKMRPAGSPLYYIATMAPVDEEDLERIERHRRERAGLGFETVEAPADILPILIGCDKSGFFLFDSVTALLANEMFGRDGSVISDAYNKVIREMDGLLDSVDNIAVVSDYIHSDACLYGDITEAYRFGLAGLHRRLAQTCDAVVETCFGSFTIHKGPTSFRDIIHAVL